MTKIKRKKKVVLEEIAEKRQHFLQVFAQNAFFNPMIISSQNIDPRQGESSLGRLSEGKNTTLWDS